VTRSDHRITDLHVFRRSMPKNGGQDIFLECPICLRYRRALYGWAAGGKTTRSAYLSRWQFRECAGLRYASEGGALLVRSRGTLRGSQELATVRNRIGRTGKMVTNATLQNETWKRKSLVEHVDCLQATIRRLFVRGDRKFSQSPRFKAIRSQTLLESD
jgi:hypothetical protein